MTEQHMTVAMVDGYVAGTLQADQDWAVEAHLESCAACRATLAERAGPATAALVDDVWALVAPQLAGSAPVPVPVRSRFRLALASWAAPLTLQWAAAVVGVLTIAVGLDRLVGGVAVEKLFLPVSGPVLALAGVLVAWGRGADPLHDLATATPRAELVLLRRVAAVLLVLVPALGGAAWLVAAPVGTSVAPALACALAAVAVGGVRRVRAVAIGLGVLWIAGVVGPAVAQLVDPMVGRLEAPALVRPELLPVWLTALGVAAAATLLRGSLGRVEVR